MLDLVPKVVDFEPVEYGSGALCYYKNVSATFMGYDNMPAQKLTNGPFLTIWPNRSTK